MSVPSKSTMQRHARAKRLGAQIRSHAHTSRWVEAQLAVQTEELDERIGARIDRGNTHVIRSLQHFIANQGATAQPAAEEEPGMNGPVEMEETVPDKTDPEEAESEEPGMNGPVEKEETAPDKTDPEEAEPEEDDVDDDEAKPEKLCDSCQAFCSEEIRKYQHECQKLELLMDALPDYDIDCLDTMYLAISDEQKATMHKAWMTINLLRYQLNKLDELCQISCADAFGDKSFADKMRASHRDERSFEKSMVDAISSFCLHSMD